MFRTALRNVLAHKARLLMTVLAVMLGVAFVSGTLVFTSTISEAFQNSSRKNHSDVDVSVQSSFSGNASPGTPETDGTERLDEATLERLQKLPETGRVTASVSSFTALADKKGRPVGDGWTTTGANYWAGQDGSGKDTRYPMKEGRAPQKSDEIALDAQTAAKTGYKPGDTVRLSVNGPVMKQKVSGVFTTTDGAVAAGGTLVLFDTATAQELLAAPGRFDDMALKAAPGTSQQELQQAVSGVVPDDAEVQTGQKLADDEAEAIQESMDGMKTGMLVFAGISLFVGIFIIANTFTMLVAQRTKELALLRAVGASRRQVTRSVRVEALLVGLVASVTGLAAGIGIAVGLRSLMDTFGLKIPDGPLVVGGDSVLTALLTGVVVTVLAAWLPARRASRIPPVAAMSSVHATATTRSLVVRNTIGALLAAAGTALVLYASTLKGADDGKFPMGAGGALLVVGVFVLTPLLSRPLIALSAPLLRMFGVAGKLARLNAVRSPRRTAATASALMIGLTLITGMTVIAGSVQHSIDSMAADSMKGDYTVTMANYSPLDPSVGERLAADENVTAASPIRQDSLRVNGGEYEAITGVDARSIDEIAELPFSSGGFGKMAEGAKGVVVDEKTAASHHWKPGSYFSLGYTDGKKEKLRVLGVYEGSDLFNGVILDNSVLEPHVDRVADTQVMVKTKDGASDSTKAALEKATGNNPALLFQDKDDVSEEAAGMVSLMLNMLYGLLAMAVAVAVLGVVNTLAMSVFERQQELGMLRAIGLSRSRIKRMVRLESLIISVFGGVMGIGLGVFFGWAAGELIGPSLAHYELVLPWGRMGIFLALAAVVGILAALWPARRAARLNMLTAIKSE